MLEYSVMIPDYQGTFISDVILAEDRGIGMTA